MSLVNLLMGYDTESPYGDKAFTDEGVKERDITLNTVSKLNSLFNKFDVSRTFFLLGSFLESTYGFIGKPNVRQIFDSDNPLSDLQQHSYSHIPFRKIATRPDKEPMQPSEIEKDVIKASKLIYDLFDRNCVGIRSPLGYALGLQNEERVVRALTNAGIKYISSDLRNKDWGIETKLIEDDNLRQPYFYNESLLEIPSHGWQDTAFTGGSKTVGTKNYPTTIQEILEHFIDLVEQAKALSKKESRNIYLGMCLHPQAVHSYDPELEFHSKLLEYSTTSKVLVSSYTDAYEKIKKNK